jgi:hypothetical protein
MNYEHPTITVTSPAPGHFVIANLPMCRVSTDEGTVVAPDYCYITPDVPTDLLKAIIAERERTAEAQPLQASEFIANLTKVGTTRRNDLANEIGVEKEEIRALDGQGFTVQTGGWCKLNEGGEA